MSRLAAESNKLKLDRHIFLDSDILIWQTNWKCLLKSHVSADDNTGQWKRENAEWLASEDIIEYHMFLVGEYLIQQSVCPVASESELVQSSSRSYKRRAVLPCLEYATADRSTNLVVSCQSVKRYVLAKICGLLRVIVRMCSQAWAYSLTVCIMCSGIIRNWFCFICIYLYIHKTKKKRI